jgi:hypothetical protein
VWLTLVICGEQTLLTKQQLQFSNSNNLTRFKNASKPQPKNYRKCFTDNEPKSLDALKAKSASLQMRFLLGLLGLTSLE